MAVYGDETSPLFERLDGEQPSQRAGAGELSEPPAADTAVTLVRGNGPYPLHHGGELLERVGDGAALALLLETGHRGTSAAFGDLDAVANLAQPTHDPGGDLEVGVAVVARELEPTACFGVELLELLKPLSC
jgi:hypothetical protein